jgi:predicted permease
MRIPISTGKYSVKHPLSLLADPMLARIRALPGVEATGLITYLPMQNWGTTTGVRFTKEEQHSEGEQPWAETRAVSPGYYQALGIHLLRGRTLSESDGEPGHVAAVVNQAFVRLYSPDQEIVGRQMFLTDGGAVTVVGVIEDSKQAGRDRGPRPEIDLPYTETIWPNLTQTMTLVVKTVGGPLAYTGPVRQAIYSVDNSQGIYGVETMEQIIADLEGDRRFAMWLLATFSIVALVLVASGLFALLSYAVSEQTHEIGVRLALGARAEDILGMIVKQGGTVTVVGLLAGLAVSLAIVKIMQSMIFSLSPASVPIFTVAALPVFAIALIASYVPARRAARVDPMIALRSE